MLSKEYKVGAGHQELAAKDRGGHQRKNHMDKHRIVTQPPSWRPSRWPSSAFAGRALGVAGKRWGWRLAVEGVRGEEGGAKPLQASGRVTDVGVCPKCSGWAAEGLCVSVRASAGGVVFERTDRGLAGMRLWGRDGGDVCGGSGAV